LILAGCGGGRHLPAVAQHSLADLMRQNGLASVTEEGITYLASGATHARSPQLLLACVPDPDTGVYPADCYDTGDAVLQIIGSVTANTTSNGMSTRYVGGAPYGDITDPGTDSPYYSINVKQALKCDGELATAASSALAMAGYIVKNAPNYAPAVAAAANNVLKTYQGTTMGVAAALEFIGGVMAAVSVWDFLTLLGLVGISAFAIHAFYRCYYSST
jgi:hypothetical protein